MRLMDAREYKGNQISVYLVQPEEDSNPLPRPALGGRLSGHLTSSWAVLPEALQLDEALAWGRRMINRAARKVRRIVRHAGKRHQHVLRGVV